MALDTYTFITLGLENDLEIKLNYANKYKFIMYFFAEANLTIFIFAEKYFK